MTLIEQVSEIIEEVYQVGGSVRDELMGRVPKDYDFASPLTPQEMEDKIKASGRRCYDIGKRFGTVGFKLNGQMIEVTTFRQEEYTHGTRKPMVSFVTSIEEDLARRDFTMNAMAKTVSGELIDPFGGQDSIRLSSITAVGNARKRFTEDPLRMLRAFRFASQFGFNIRTETYHALLEMSEHILHVSKERWVQELDKMLMGDVSDSLLRDFKETLGPFMLPEVFLLNSGEYVAADVRGAETLDEKWSAFLDPSTPLVDSDLVRVLRSDIFYKEQRAKMCAYLKFSKERTRFILENS